MSIVSRLSDIDVLARAIETDFAGRIAVVSSFGAESAVLLHMVAQIDPATPVIFVDTGRHFAETLAYRDRLMTHLGLTNLIVAAPLAHDIAAHDPEMLRAGYDPDGCCALRKVEPLERALGWFDAWISGRKRHQAATRTTLPLVEQEGGRTKINPLADWGPVELAAYMALHRLPAHPLVAEGYPSIGCEACTSRVAPGEDPRAGRWRAFNKIECGIHIVANAKG